MSKSSPAADAAEESTKATDRDPLKAQAHRLATLAMEQPIKPDLRSDGNPFSAVMGIFERELRRGQSVQSLNRAVLAGIEVWTVAGVQTAVAKSQARTSQRQAAASRLVDRIMADGRTA